MSPNHACPPPQRLSRAGPLPQRLSRPGPPRGAAALLAAALPLVPLGACDRGDPVLARAEPLTATPSAGAAEAPQPLLPPGPAGALPARPAAPRVQSGVFPGTGVLVGPPRPDQSRPAAAARGGAVVTSGGEVELSFVGADVREVARVVLQDILGLNFAVDPSASSPVTLETSAPIPREAVLPAFEATLRLSNLALSVQNGLYIVTQAPAAARTGIVGRNQPGFGTEVVAPRFVGVAQLRRLIEPVLRDGQVAQVDASRNLMLVTGTEPERRAVREMVAQFDVDWMRGMSFSIYAARRVPARRLAEELTQLLGGEGAAVAGLVRIVPLERLNAVLAISPQERYLRQLQVWADRLDREGQGDERQVFVYRVQNGRAGDLARVLARAFGATGGGADPGQAARGGTAGAGPGGLFQGGGRGLSGSSSRIANPLETPLAGPELLLQAPDPGGAGGTGAPDAVPFGGGGAIPPLSPPGLGAPAPFGGGAGLAPQLAGGGAPSITSDETNNALVIVGTPRQYELLQAALRQLDVLPLQVLIEASVAEVTLTNQLRFGLQWALTSGQSTAALNQRQLDPSAAATGTGAALNALRGALLPRVADASVPVPSYPNFSYIYSAPNITVVLEALDQITSVNVLSAPQLLVLNNQTASLQVGDQVPVQTQSAQSVITSGAPLVSSIEYRDTGVILRITPRVNESGLVLLDIAQEVSAVVQSQNTTVASTLSPTIQQRRVASSIAVQDGQTVALGGLIRDARSRNRGGIPLLSDIPGLGYLFGRANDGVERTELLVLLTPRVVRNQADAGAVTEELRTRLRSLRPIETPFPRAPGSGRMIRGQPGF